MTASSLYKQHRIDLLRRLRALKPAQRLAELGRWSVYRSAGLHPRCFVGVSLAVAWSSWPAPLRTEFLTCWTALKQQLMSAEGPFWRWPSAAFQLHSEALAHFARTYPQYIGGLPLAVELFLARLFLLAGQLDLYFYHREHFVERAGQSDLSVLLNADDTLPAMYRMSWANEQADAQTHGLLKQQLSLCLHDQPQAHRAFLHSSYLYQTHCADYAREAVVGQQDAGFAQLIRGRRVAIVGPVDVGVPNGAEIDGFDLVIRPTHRAGNALPAMQFGCRTDVAYYLEDDLAQGSPDDFLPVMRDLRYVVLSDNCLQRFDWLHSLGDRLRPRYEIGIRRNPFLVGYPTAIPRILMDVLRFSPAQVKVFNCNLYLSSRYAGNYLRDSSFDFYPGFTLHDPLSNFIFMQRAWLGGWFQADAVLTDILALSAQEYQDAFSRAHAEVR